MAEEPEHFVLGVTMAGAVSAGAYTAGVLDFLFRALDAHNARVAEGLDDPAAPRHRVVLKVMSGASAGGVCAALGLAGLVGSQRSSDGRLDDAIEVRSKPAPGCTYTYSYALKTLHDVWVMGLDLWRPTEQKGFLALDDFDSGTGRVQSVLNSAHIDEVAQKALSDIRSATGGKFSFLTNPFDVFLTATNLMGVPYKVRFASGSQRPDEGHRMAQHGAVRHFRMTGLGAAEEGSHWLDQWGDEGIPLPLPDAGGPLPLDDPSSPWSSFQTASIATGAFPVGLAPRLIEAEMQDFARIAGAEKARGGALPIDAHPKTIGHAAPEFGKDAQASSKVRFVAVDGGLINNEPFEYARFTIRKEGGDFLQPNPRAAEEADRAVLMIDPFPEGPEYEAMSLELAEAEKGLIPSALKLFPSLKNQARFKPAELIHAAKGDVHSRFLVFPARSEGDGQPARSGAEAIASGGLGGFLGFADESFRMHDFILGQRNCQRFLQKHFLLAASNPVLRLPDDHPDKAGNAMRRIVDPGDALDQPIALPTWPRLDGERLALVLAQARLRISKVGERVLDEASPSATLSWVLRKIWNLRGPVRGVEHHVEKGLVRLLTAELILRDQHADYADLSEGMRRVVAEMVSRGDKPARVQELIDAANDKLKDGEELGVRERDVAETLERLAERGLVWRQRLTLGKRRYCHGHTACKPGTIKKLRLALNGN